MAQGRIVLTADIDWASEHCIRSFIDHAAGHGIVPTLFVTHRSTAIAEAAEAGKVHLGIHPNFLTGSSHGASIEEVLDFVLDLVPRPVAARNHCFFDNSNVSAAMAERGIQLDSNICCHLQDGLPILEHWNGVRRLPVFFEDDVHWVRGGSWALADHEAAFTSPGLKILNFHPFMWALNAPDARFYEAHRSHIPSLTEAEAASLRFRGPGSATFLDEVIDWARRTGREFVGLPDLCNNE